MLEAGGFVAISRRIVYKSPILQKWNKELDDDELSIFENYTF